jgi:hypothetical protein
MRFYHQGPIRVAQDDKKKMIIDLIDFVMLERGEARLLAGRHLAEC